MTLSTKKQSAMVPTEQDKDRPLTSILHRASIIDTLRQQDDVVPDFQRVTITGEETSGVSRLRDTIYTVSQKNDTDVTHYRFNPHQPISVIFGRDVAERIRY